MLVVVPRRTALGGLCGGAAWSMIGSNSPQDMGYKALMDFSRFKVRLSWPHGKRPFILLAVAVVLGVVVLVMHVDFGGNELIDKLKSGNTEERLEAIDELSAEGSEEGLRAIAEVVQDADTRVACRALLVLATTRLEDRRERIMRAAEDERPEVRRIAMVGIGRLQDKGNAEMLATVVRDRQEDPHVRAAAVQAIGELRAWKYRHAALDVLDDPSPLVRGRAAAALHRMTGRNFGFRANATPQERAVIVALMRKMLR